MAPHSRSDQSKETLAIATINVKGLASAGRFESFEAWMISNHLDIALIQETHMPGTSTFCRNGFTYSVSSEMDTPAEKPKRKRRPRGQNQEQAAAETQEGEHHGVGLPIKHWLAPYIADVAAHKSKRVSVNSWLRDRLLHIHNDYSPTNSTTSRRQPTPQTQRRRSVSTVT